MIDEENGITDDIINSTLILLDSIDLNILSNYKDIVSKNDLKGIKTVLKEDLNIEDEIIISVITTILAEKWKL